MFYNLGAWLLYFNCLLDGVLWIFLTVPWVDLQRVIVVYPDHNHFFYVLLHTKLNIKVMFSGKHEVYSVHSKTCVKTVTLKRAKIGFQEQSSLNAGHKYFRMLQGEHSAILLTFIKLPFVIKIFVLSIFDWPFYTGLTV